MRTEQEWEQRRIEEDKLWEMLFALARHTGLWFWADTLKDKSVGAM